MGTVVVRRTGLACLSLITILLALGLARCAPTGGPPYAWVCTPANLDFGNTASAEVSIFNGGAATATLATTSWPRTGRMSREATSPPAIRSPRTRVKPEATR